MMRFIFRLFGISKDAVKSYDRSLDVFVKRKYRRFKPGDQIICLEAPWHTGTMACEPCMVNFGPSKHSIVTVDKYLDGHYIKLQEFPMIFVDGVVKDPGYLDTFFVDADEINISEINQILAYGND